MRGFFMYTLPWVEEIKLRYTSSESSIFVLHGNIRDLYPSMTEDGELLFLDIQHFLTQFLQRTKDYVLYYNLSDGLRVEKGPKDGIVNKVNRARLQKKCRGCDRICVWKIKKNSKKFI